MLKDVLGQTLVVGHNDVQEALERLELSNVLLVGPWSVGKRTLLEKIWAAHGITDVVRILDLKSSDIEAIRRASLESAETQRVIFIRMASSIPNSKYEKLLKIIEDAPQEVAFHVTSTYMPQLQFRSRFTTMNLHYLTNEEVAAVLRGLGYSSVKAVELAQLGLGSVRETIQAEKSSPFLSSVNRALKCIEDHDEDALDGLYSKWEDGHTNLLLVWARERITEKWRRFQESDFPNLTKGHAMKLLQRVDPFDKPRYVVRVTLVSIARGE